MVLDDDPSTGNAAPLDSAKKNKQPIKKVLQFDHLIYFVYNNHCYQVLEKRPEVRLLEYCDVPGITLCPQLVFAQKAIASSAKRVKLEHPSCEFGRYYLPDHFFWSILTVFPGHSAPTRHMHEFKGCSEEALSVAEVVAHNPPIDPSRSALQAHIADLEADLRSVDFRLQNFYHQRTVVSGILDDAKSRLLSDFY